jgi:hypothetical protein
MDAMRSGIGKGRLELVESITYRLGLLTSLASSISTVIREPYRRDIEVQRIKVGS